MGARGGGGGGGARGRAAMNSLVSESRHLAMWHHILALCYVACSSSPAQDLLCQCSSVAVTRTEADPMLGRTWNRPESSMVFGALRVNTVLARALRRRTLGQPQSPTDDDDHLVPYPWALKS